MVNQLPIWLIFATNCATLLANPVNKAGGVDGGKRS
jgi:hypothetical protein